MSKDWQKEYERLWVVSSSGIILNAKLKIFIEDLLQQQQEKFLEMLKDEKLYKNEQLHGHSNKNIIIRNKLRQQLREKVKEL